MRSQKIQQLIDKYIEGQTSTAEEVELEKFLKDEDFGKDLDEEKLLFELFDQNRRDKLSSGFDDLLEMKLMEKEESSDKIRRLNPIQKTLGIAASLIFIVAITWLNWPETQLETITQTTTDQSKQISLPDGTTVYLNQNSSLTYLEDFGLTERNVSLTGEAFFEVKRDESKPFKVVSGHSITTVLGTAFNIRNRVDENDIVVTVTHGKVSFASHNSQLQEQVFLTSDQKASYSKLKNVIVKTKAIDLNNLHWQTGRLQFNSTSISEVIEDLTFAYNCQVEVANSAILNCPFTGNFENENIEDIMQVLAFSLNLQVKKTQNSYELIGKGCQVPM